jgi:hypothetical protein
VFAQQDGASIAVGVNRKDGRQETDEGLHGEAPCGSNAAHDAFQMVLGAAVATAAKTTFSEQSVQLG